MNCIELVRRVCPACNAEYVKRPAVSRVDGRLICPECGIREALDSIGITEKADQDHVIELIKEYERERR